MKIAIDARFYGSENGGLGRYTMNLLAELEKKLDKNTYILLLNKKYYKTLRTPKNFEKVLVTSRHYSFSEQLELPRILGRIKPDITHFLHFNVPLLYKGAYIVTIHDLLMHEGVGKEATTLPVWKHLIKRMGYRIVFDHAVRRARQIICPSLFVKKQIITTYNLAPQKISVIYEGVSLVHTKPALKHKNYFLYVGNAYPHKNIKTLLQAIGLINQHSQNIIKLILVTPRDVFTSRLTDQIKKMGVSKFVDIQSGVSDMTLKSLYTRAAAFVYPSFSEGFGLPGLEAMQCKTRLISSSIPVFHEIYKTHAEYFEPQSSEELTLSLEKILKEKPMERNQKLAAAYLFAKSYSWEKMARATLAIYEKS